MNTDRLKSIITERCQNVDQVVIALSGGVDSSLVAALAYEVLNERCVAVTVQSELTSGREFTRAVEMAEHIGIEHHPLMMRILEKDAIRKNSEDRCYHCKRAIFDLMLLEYGDECVIMDGTNTDDDPLRPGLQAIREFGVLSPLKEAGLTKQDVRQYAQELGLPSWDRPSESCLATRIPVGTPLSQDWLEKIEIMESFFHYKGVETLRVYSDNLMATVEYLPQYAEIIRKNRDKFAALIEKIGLRSFIFKELSL